MSYDEAGHKYDLPVFVINPPDRFDIKSEKLSTFDSAVIQVKLQFLNFMETLELTLNDSVADTVQKAIEFVRAKESYDPDVDVVRLVYRGKVLKNEHKLGNYLKGNDLIQVFKTLKK